MSSYKIKDISRKRRRRDIDAYNTDYNQKRGEDNSTIIPYDELKELLLFICRKNTPQTKKIDYHKINIQTNTFNDSIWCFMFVCKKWRKIMIELLESIFIDYMPREWIQYPCFSKCFSSIITTYTMINSTKILGDLLNPRNSELIRNIRSIKIGKFMDRPIIQPYLLTDNEFSAKITSLSLCNVCTEYGVKSFSNEINTIFQKFTNITKLDISNSDIKIESIVHLAPKLISLNISKKRYDDSVIDYKLFTNLRKLNISNPFWTIANRYAKYSGDNISVLTNLTRLNINNNHNISNNHICNMVNLKRLDAKNTQTSIRKILHLLTNLTWLDLSDCKISTLFDYNIKNLTNLEHLNLYNTIYEGTSIDQILPKLIDINISHSSDSDDSIYLEGEGEEEEEESYDYSPIYETDEILLY